MNGKIKTKFAALFAVALMITVCCVPLVDSEGYVEAASDASTGDVFDSYSIKLYKPGDDLSDFVYYGVFPATLNDAEWEQIGEDLNISYLNKETGKYLRAGDIPGGITEENITSWDLPAIQLVYEYDDAEVNSINAEVDVFIGNSKTAYDLNGTSGDGSTGTAFRWTVSDLKSVGNITIHLYQDLGLNEATAVGDFKVVVKAKQGLESQEIAKTVNAGPAVTVSGTVSDANNQAIIPKLTEAGAFSEGIKVNATIYEPNTGGVTNWYETDASGKYSFNVAPGRVVVINDIGYFATSGKIGSTANDMPYTFDEANGSKIYSFGTVNSSVSKNFKANEYTRYVTINTADSKVIAGETADLDTVWYSQTSTTSNSLTVYNIQLATSGKAIQVDGATDSNGKIRVAYKAPTDASNSDTTYTYYLIINAPDAIADGDFEFDDAGTLTDADATSSITTQVSAHKGSANATSNNVTLYANESVVEIKVASKNSNPISGASDITVGWYSQQASTTSGKYKISTYTSVAKKIDTATGSDGIIKVAYVKPTATEGVTFYLYVSEDTNANPGVDSGYTFITSVIATGDDVENTIAKQLEGKAGSKAVSSGSLGSTIVLNAKEDSYKVSGNVGVEGATVSFTNTTTGGLLGTDDSDKDGNYSLYLIKGTYATLSPSKSDVTFVPSQYSIPGVETNVTVNFTKYVAPATPVTVNYDVTGVTNTEVVTFTYSINGISSTKVATHGYVDENGDSDFDEGEYAYARLALSLMPGDVVNVSVVAVKSGNNEYEVVADGKYSWNVNLIYTNNWLAVDNNGKAIPNASMTVKYVVDNLPVYEVVEFDAEGKATFSSIYEISAYYFNGAEITADVTGTKSIFEGDGVVTYTLVDFDNAYAAPAGASVVVSYVAAVNNTSDAGFSFIAAGDYFVVDAGESVALKAPAVDGFKFVGWMVDGVLVSESADYSLKAESNTAYTVDAYYVADQYEAPADKSNELSMDVLVLGIIIVVLGIIAVAYGIISKKQ